MIECTSFCINYQKSYSNSLQLYLHCSKRLCIWRCSHAAEISGSQSLAQSLVCALQCCAGVSSQPRPLQYCPEVGHTCTSPHCQSFPGTEDHLQWAVRLIFYDIFFLLLCECAHSEVQSIVKTFFLNSAFCWKPQLRVTNSQFFHNHSLIRLHHTMPNKKVVQEEKGLQI